LNAARAAVAARILRLPPADQAIAIQQLRLIHGALDKKGARAQAARDVRQRRKYAGDPWAYHADIFGLTLTQQQEDVLDILNSETRVLIPSANNVGKTFLLGGWGVYCFDALGALEGDDEDEQGARILLPGPDHPTVFATIYSRMLALALRAERRGHLMPGERSENSVLWRVRPEWEVEAFSPPKRVGQNVAHTASGRHHRNQRALIEEGQGVPEAVWRASEGMCSSEGNQVASSFNPTESTGPAYQRAQSSTYRVIHLSAFQHPNILRRENVIAGAVAFSVIDARVRDDTRDRGPYPATPLEAEQNDIVYALPPKDAEETGPRADGIPGHPDGQPRVYRPNAAFTAQVLGQWASDSDGGLFRPGDWDAAVQRWKRSPDPVNPPDRVGVDPRREGKDEFTAAPAWGPTAGALLRLYADAQLDGIAAVEAVRAQRVRVGEIKLLPRGDGVDTALALDKLFPRSPFIMDEASVGSSPYDHLRRVLHRDVTGVTFSNAPLGPLPGEPYCENLRTQLYVRAMMLVHRGLVDPPADPILREEILAHRVEAVRKTIERRDKDGRWEKVRVDAVALIAKDEIKKIIGRSPDRSDAFVVAVFDAPPSTRRQTFVPASESYYSI
jgi:hypothetical protein